MTVSDSYRAGAHCHTAPADGASDHHWSYQLLSRPSSLPYDHKRRDKLFEQAAALASTSAQFQLRLHTAQHFPHAVSVNSGARSKLCR
jgi:hypothetical protein